MGIFRSKPERSQEFVEVSQSEHFVRIATNLQMSTNLEGFERLYEFGILLIVGSPMDAGYLFVFKKMNWFAGSTLDIHAEFEKSAFKPGSGK